MRLTSWEKKGLAWGEPAELTRLQNCIENMIDKKIKLVNVVQVMLVHRILPCQRRAFNMWEFDPAEHQMLHELFDTTHKDVWKVLFKTTEVPPPTSKDRGLSATLLDNLVSSQNHHKMYLTQHVRGRILSHHAFIKNRSTW